jgi:hypothetical protein
MFDRGKGDYLEVGLVSGDEGEDLVLAGGQDGYLSCISISIMYIYIYTISMYPTSKSDLSPVMRARISCLPGARMDISISISIYIQYIYISYLEVGLVSRDEGEDLVLAGG